MIDFNDPARWVILQYLPGSGGKFLCSALMTIDRISHWDYRVETGLMSFKDWVNTQWLKTNSDKWIAFEPLHDWHTTFFSRTFPRGNDITLEQYNNLMNETASQYLKNVWRSDKLLLDFLNKAEWPRWWANSKHITLSADKDNDTYRQFLLNKIYPYDPVTKIGEIMMDKPIDENKYQNARKFANQYKFGPFDNIDQWYDFIWKNDFRLNFNVNDADFNLIDLLDYQSLHRKISKIADDLDSNFNSDDLYYLFEYWMLKNSLTQLK